jgi:beta-lactam-binding protein with PASTA domain
VTDVPGGNPGHVRTQTPAGGTKVAPGSTVTISVSRAAATTTSTSGSTSTTTARTTTTTGTGSPPGLGA